MGAVAEDRTVDARPPRQHAEAHLGYLVDAEGLRLGRMASECAKILLGKNKATFTPGADVGDAIVIVNAEKISGVLAVICMCMCNSPCRYRGWHYSRTRPS